MLKGFKDFLLRGNVIDLSVAVVMGAAFSGVVTSFTDKLVRPLLNAITPPTSPGLSAQLVDGKPSTVLDFAAVITAAVNFVVVAGVVYAVIVLPMRTIQRRRRRGEEAGPSEPTDVELLIEIRDLLAAQVRGAAAPAGPGGRAAQAGAADTPTTDPPGPDAPGRRTQGSEARARRTPGTRGDGPTSDGQRISRPFD